MTELTYALGGFGIALAIVALWQTMRRAIHVEMAMAVLNKLIGNGDLMRLIKLCSAAPMSVFDAVKAAALAGGSAAQRSRDRVSIDAAVLPAFDDTGKALASVWLVWCNAGLFASAVIGGSFLLAYNDKIVGTPHYVFAATAGLFALVFSLRRAKVPVGLALLRARTIAMMIDGLVDGKLSTDKASAPPVATTTTAGPNALVFAISKNGDPVRTDALDLDVIKVGRLASAHLQLDDEAVSRMHAVIERADGDVKIIDLGSDSGTLVNGEKVNKATLAYGDSIQIGPFTMMYMRPGTAVSPPDPFRVAGGTPKPEPAKVANAPSLRDGVCPICKHETIKTITRTDTRFQALVCAGCGYTQDFANLSALGDS